MISGTVSADQQAVVTIEIMDGDGVLRSLEVILDTGFTGYLTLPSEAIEQLGLAVRRSKNIRVGLTGNYSGSTPTWPPCRGTAACEMRWC